MTDRSVVQELKEALSITVSAQSAAMEVASLAGPAMWHTHAGSKIGKKYLLNKDRMFGRLNSLQVKLQSLLDNATESSQKPSTTLESAGLHHKMIEWADSSSQCSDRTVAKEDSLPEHSTRQTNPSPSPSSPAPDVCLGFPQSPMWYDGKDWWQWKKVLGEVYGWSKISSPLCGCGKKVCQR